MLAQAEEERAKGNAIELDAMLGRTRTAIAAQLHGDRYRLSWQELMRDEASSPDERRQLVMVKPRLDYGTLFPGGRAIAAVREVGRDLGLSGEGRCACASPAGSRWRTRSCAAVMTRGGDDRRAGAR